MRSAPAASRTRIFFLGAVAFLWLGLLLGRLVDLQILRYADFARRAHRQQQRILEVTPQRGVLYDRNHRPLAISISVDSVFAVPGEVTDPVRAARLLAPVLGLEPALLANRLRSPRSFVWLKRKLDAAEVERVRALELAGIHFQREFKRFYPKRELAAHVLGFVGIDENGLAGIEYALDTVIRGRPRRLVITADGRRRWFARRNQVPAEGASVVLTLDENIQYIVEQELAVAMTRSRARSGTIIVQDPHTGEVLALANSPSFNPNNPTAVPPARHLNRALSLVYEPGSTFKVVAVAAALEEKLTQPGEVFDCRPGSIVIAGHRIRDHKPFGRLSLREVIEQSSDVGTITIGLRLGNKKLYENIRRWHFGQPTGIELPAESGGLLRPLARWSRISIGAISIGQEIAITPLQLAAAISAIANGGTWIQPRIVRQIIRGNQPEPVASPQRERIISVGVAQELRRMLVGVVRRGTGRAAQPVGYSAAGKTGTAQKVDESGAYSRTDFVASFAGFAPARDPVVSVVVVIDSPRGPRYHGGEVAAPLFRKVVERVLAYLNVPRDLPMLPEPSRRPIERAAMQDFQPGQFEPTSWLEDDSRLTAAAPGAGITPAGQSEPRFWRTGLNTRNTVVMVKTDTVVVPDLIGLSLRAVGEKCARLGLEPILAGSGVVVAQRPGPVRASPAGVAFGWDFVPRFPRRWRGRCEAGETDTRFYDEIGEAARRRRNTERRWPPRRGAARDFL
ncbi:MAG: penicillin-binding transpeptidase domain-containing protein [Terriglobia bacterium]